MHGRCLVSRHCSIVAAGFVMLGLLVPSNSLPAAPITFNTALPVAEGEFVFREQIVLDRATDDPSGAERERSRGWFFTNSWARVSGVDSVLWYGPHIELQGERHTDKTETTTER